MFVPPPCADKILRKMGEGTFARVCECWDRKERERVAIKIIRNVPKYHDAAIIELDVLKVPRGTGRKARECVFVAFGLLGLFPLRDRRAHIRRVSPNFQLPCGQTLRRHDAEDTNGVVHLQSFFLYRDHICMVFKKLGLR